jgi:transposase
VWVPDKQTRDDRDLVRARLDVRKKVTALKAQVRSLLKRSGIKKKPSGLGQGWTRAYRAWLVRLSDRPGELGLGARAVLRSLLRQMAGLEEEIRLLDADVQELASTDRYREAVSVLTSRCGVGVLTAMVFLAEMGDLSRFSNRKRVGSYLGLVPSSDDSGEREHKGHITHQGSSRVRKVLCQAAWALVRHDRRERSVYERILSRNPKHKKIALVACMRRLGIWMWRHGLEAQRSA